MNSPNKDWAGDAALHAMGRLPAEEVPAFEAETEASPLLAREFDELRSIAKLLDLAETREPLLIPSPDRRMQERLVTAVARTRRERRRTARLRIGAVVAAAAAAVVIVASIIVVSGGGDSTDFAEFEVASGDAVGRYALAANDLGTAITLEVGGLEPSAVYWLWLTDDAGVRTSAGTFRGAGDEDAEVVLQSGLPLDEAARIWVTDASYAVVLDSHLGSGQ